ncbi:MAG TPA: amidohydrolase family protein [Steroidobacteraceae bacterium]|jgi:imidazolonepropionase-like amidohydrolase|nr:amidohydrolase family protein [Steroidobacteraceae bacterium]
MRAVIAIALLACAVSANAQDLFIRGATVHTAGEQGVLSNADVLVRDGKIAAVGSGLNAPSGVSTVDAQGRALTPGLFGGLTAIGIEEVSLEPTTVDSAVILHAPAFEMAWRPEFDVTSAYNPRSVLVPVARIEGLTWTMLSPASDDGGALLTGQGGAVALDGRYDSVLAGTHALFINLGGDANAVSAGSRAGQWMLLEQAIRETRSPTAQDEHLLLHPLGREALAKYLNGGRVVFNVNRAADIRRAVAFAKRNGMKPIIAGGAEAWVVADELAREKVPVLLDALVNLPYNFDDIGARLDNATLLNKAGVRIAFTQFNESHNARKIRQLAGNAVAHGLPKDAAIAALTSEPAEIFGLAGERGRIARGQAADLVLWSGDPLEVTSAADQVWIGGRAVEMRSRQTELRDRYLKRLQ